MTIAEGEDNGVKFDEGARAVNKSDIAPDDVDEMQFQPKIAIENVSGNSADLRMKKEYLK